MIGSFQPAASPIEHDTGRARAVGPGVVHRVERARSGRAGRAEDLGVGQAAEPEGVEEPRLPVRPGEARAGNAGQQPVQRDGLLLRGRGVDHLVVQDAPGDVMPSGVEQRLLEVQREHLRHAPAAEDLPPDLVAVARLALQQEHLVPVAGQYRGERRAGDPASHDRHVHGHVGSSVHGNPSSAAAPGPGPRTRLATTTVPRTGPGRIRGNYLFLEPGETTVDRRHLA